MRRFLRSIARDRNGATTIEYTLIGALASVAIISAVEELSDTTSDVFKTVAAKVAGQSGTGSPNDPTLGSAGGPTAGKPGGPKPSKPAKSKPKKCDDDDCDDDDDDDD